MRACPVCQSESRDLIYQTPTGQMVFGCFQCGMVFSDGLAPVDYSKDSIYTCAETYQSQAAHYERIVKNIGIQPAASVLDVGCATGGLMKAFIAEGHPVVHGLSLSAGEVALCEEQGLTAFHRDIASMGMMSPYDLVTVSHVLEHVPNVAGFLHDLRRWVKPGGLVYVEVPDATNYLSCFRSICQGFNSEHINHFSTYHLCELLNRSGYDCQISGTYKMSIERSDSEYPCAWAVAKPRSVGFPSLRSSVANYAACLKLQLATVMDRVREELASIPDLTVWGMGETTRLLISSGVVNADKVVAGVDTNPVYHGKIVYGIFVYDPASFHPPSNLPILVCSQTRKTEIIARIKEFGLTNRIITI